MKSLCGPQARIVLARPCLVEKRRENEETEDEQRCGRKYGDIVAFRLPFVHGPLRDADKRRYKLSHRSTFQGWRRRQRRRRKGGMKRESASKAQRREGVLRPHVPHTKEALLRLPFEMSARCVPPDDDHLNLSGRCVAPALHTHRA
ncbi:unnamed protein product [Pleuronectes platessa]|uniref:Uncharacterized protein n=1 Tax=Pleuronectes platessa TaxID=8262 RepID=A0A9N7Y6B9_PLEPL|nr:unnamed protein product [Pleuronectes platessa]